MYLPQTHSIGWAIAAVVVQLKQTENVLKAPQNTFFTHCEGIHLQMT